MTSIARPRATSILTTWLKAIKEQEKKNLPLVEEELGETIALSGHTIEAWRGGKRRPDLSQAVTIIKEIVRRLKNVRKEDFFEFLREFGHPNPAEIWDELFPAKPLYGPAPVEYFIGREQKRQELIKALQPGHVVTLYGTGGVGKTALVAQVLQALVPHNQPSEQFPDGIFFHDFYKQASVDAALEQIYRIFGKDEPPLPTPRDAARRALANKQVLLVLDGAEEADDLDKVLGVRDRDRNGVLIVTRYRHMVHGTAIALDVLPLSEAVQLLMAWSMADSAQTKSWVWDDDQAANHVIAEEICELVGCLPLALRLAGRYMVRSATASTYLQLLKTTPLAGLQEDARQHHSVPVLLMYIVNEVKKIRAEAYDVLAVLGLLAYDIFSLEVIASTLARSPATVLLSIDILVRFGMVKWCAEERYQIVHRLIHTCAKQLPTPEKTLAQLATYYTKLAKEQSRMGLEGYKRLAPERAHMVTVVTNCAVHQQWTEVVDLAWAINKYLDLQGYWLDHLTVVKAALSAMQAQQDRKREAAVLNTLGSRYSDLGDYPMAIDCYEQALAIARESGNRRSERIALNNLGNGYYYLGEYEKAIDYYQAVLTRTRETGERDDTDALGNLGNAYIELKQYEQAIPYCQQAITLAQASGDRASEAYHLNNLGWAYDCLEQYEQAIHYCQQALVIAKEIGDRSSEARCLGNLGNAYRGLDQLEIALSYYEQAFTIAYEIKDPLVEGMALFNLARMYHLRGEVEKARTHYQQALHIYEAINSPHVEEARRWLKTLEAN